ncbi:MAG: CYTH domain-containing protein [Ardenticatenaceae bacterium]|nr:CYTH domain-containing protein [Ardenticatenaceae bacterium]
MGLEIERKFLVRNDSWRTVEGTPYRQGYLNSNLHRVVRVRTMGETAVITVKGLNSGAVRREFEYAIPLADAKAMLDDLCERPLIEKTRYKVEFAGHTWEIDEFFGDNAGLVVAELELQSVDEDFAKPDWLGEEVTDDPRYFNSNLVLRPYTTW